MRKSIIFAAVLVAAATSCQKAMMQEPESLGTFSIRATREACADTKASINSTSGEFTWSAGDAIGIWNGSSFQELTTENDGVASATFTGTTEGTLSGYAVFPYAIGKSVSGSTVTVTLPDSYEWKEGEVAAPMIATYDASSLSFKHLGGVVMVTLNNVPANAAKFVFNTDKDITGDYTVTSGGEIQSAGNATNNEVAFTFTLTAATDMEFYVPVPVGEYKFGFKLYDAAGNLLSDNQGTTANAVNRAVLLKMPALTFTTTSGGGEGTISTTSIPAGHEGTFYLPDTSSDVIVNVAGYCPSVELVYAAGGAKPANVTINSGPMVQSLIINLPNSHVNLVGGYYVTVTSNTSLNTLVIDGTVSINSKLNVAGGSAKIAGTVQEVEIQESVAADAKIVFAPNADVTVVNTKSPAQIVITPGTVSGAITVSNPDSAEYLATYSAPIIELQDGASVNISGDAAIIESTTKTSASGEQQYSKITVKSGNEKGLRYAIKNCESVTLGADIEVSRAIEIDHDLNLWLSDYSIKAKSGMTADAVIIVRAGGDLTIDCNTADDGTDAGMVTTSRETGVDAAIKVTDDGGDHSRLTINHGIFEGTNHAIVGELTDEHKMIHITITGGTFYGDIYIDGNAENAEISKDGGTFK